MHTFIRILVFSILTMQAYAADQINDMLIIPGERVGPITANTTEDEIKELLPGAEIKRMYSSMPPDGGYACVTVIYPETDKALEIFWSNEQSFDYSDVSDKINGNLSSEESQKLCESLPSFKNVDYVFPGPAWHTKEGINSGMSVEDLEKINGAPLTIDTSESCFGGGINEWNGGKADVDNIRMAFSGSDFWWEGKPEPNTGSVISTELPNDIKKKAKINYLEVSLTK